MELYVCQTLQLLLLFLGTQHLRSGVIKLRNTLTYINKSKKDPLSGKWDLLEVDLSSLVVKNRLFSLFNTNSPSSSIIFDLAQCEIFLPCINTGLILQEKSVKEGNLQNCALVVEMLTFTIL